MEPIKQIISGTKARNKILSGSKKVYLAVSTTLGSKGRNVALEENWGAPLVVHDGVTVAKKIVLEDAVENMASKLIIQAAEKTNEQAGDGTTTATILAYWITKYGAEMVGSGINPMALRKSINLAVDEAISFIKKQAKEVKDDKDVIDVATISCADAHMGNIIAQAVIKVGRDGVVTVQDSNSLEPIAVEYKEGMDLASGWIHPAMVNTGQEDKVRFVTQQPDDEPYIVVFDRTMTNQDLSHVGDLIANDADEHKRRAKYVFIAPEFDGDLASSLIVSRVRNKLELVAIKAPEFGEYRTNLLHDIALITGGNLIGGKEGLDIKNVRLEDIGRANKVEVSQNHTIILGGKGDKKKLTERINSIKDKINTAVNEFIKDKHQSRLMKLTNGVAVVNIGGHSEVERKEQRERAYDAVQATKAAVDEGIVPGGGVILALAARHLIDIQKKTDDHVLSAGLKVVIKALQRPLHKLASNAGHDNPGYVVGKIMESEDKLLGYNVETEEFENMIKSGIIDPVKVTRCALTNAASVATMLITTEVAVPFVRERVQSKNSVDDAGIGNFPD